MKKLFSSRDNYLSVIVDTIVRNHSGEGQDESFVFGLSAKWGEGKTFFLKKLEKHLEVQGYKVCWFRPWKFAKDRNSLLREFLKKIDVNQVVQEKKFHQRSFVEINMNRFIKLGALLVAAVYLFSHLTGVEWFFTGSVEVIEQFGTVLLVPFLIPLFVAVVTLQSRAPASEDLDQFNCIFDEVIGSYIQHGTKIIVFVDDLDRCLPAECRSVLDDLRTFFDSKLITYVVTGDHVTLEKNIGEELVRPDTRESQMLVEGRRYLKKIFNVYWRLPAPLPTELDGYLSSDIFGPHEEELQKISDQSEDQFDVSYLKKCFEVFFDRNLREIERFVDLLIFNYKIVEIGLKNVSDDLELKEFYLDLIRYPKLLVRVLLIQEFCTPLFDVFMNSLDVFEKIERGAVKGEYQLLKEFPQDRQQAIRDSLTDGQSRKFIEILQLGPHFFDDKGNMKPSSFEPFFYLSATKDLSNLRGVDPEKFWETLGSLETLNKDIIEYLEVASKLRIQRIFEYLDQKYQELLGDAQDTDKNQIIIRFSRLVQVLSTTEKYRSDFVTLFAKWDFSKLFNLGFDKKTLWEVFIAYKNWLNSVEVDFKPQTDAMLLHGPKELKSLKDDGEEKFLRMFFLEFLELGRYELGDITKLLLHPQWKSYFLPIVDQSWKIILTKDSFLDYIFAHLQQFVEDFNDSGLAPKQPEAEELLLALLVRMPREKQVGERTEKLKFLVRQKTALWSNLTKVNFHKVNIHDDIKKLGPYRSVVSSYNS